LGNYFQTYDPSLNHNAATRQAGRKDLKLGFIACCVGKLLGVDREAQPHADSDLVLRKRVRNTPGGIAGFLGGPALAVFQPALTGK